MAVPWVGYDICQDFWMPRTPAFPENGRLATTGLEQYRLKKAVRDGSEQIAWTRRLSVLGQERAGRNETDPGCRLFDAADSCRDGQNQPLPSVYRHDVPQMPKTEAHRHWPMYRLIN
ncbi:hypothetical protein [Nocardiopsis ansamitocini]|uniref:Uncharacterized protein n=1 Tax=Nocardiopsis ansamitocini TaxID=1670832 RepID=A0A9W6PBJ7_9ACTN|nr:hypothetical protein [Nocardiopsis ansamitocini]GLU50517.1 hypothetical protein Nans01_48680 [Nocardiopsis ansamitocini]